MLKEIKSKYIPESYQLIKHKSGLDILLFPMEGFSSSYAMFTTKYGSVDTTFKTNKDDDFLTVPEGIAHFLEHKLFEGADGEDAFTRYAQTGASANAFTSFGQTSYLFSCTENFNESLEILLDFVTHPYFTPETVEKEQGIIDQEIKMYQDNPGWRVFFEMLRGMYHNNPVSIDIAGTVESIAEITDDLLYRSYNTFYNLNNMVLTVAGNFKVEDVLKLADDILKPAEEIVIETKTPTEPFDVKSDYIEISLPIAQPLFQLGFKGDPTNEKDDAIRALKEEILLEIIAGEASPLYKRLYEDGLISSGLGTSAESGRGYSYTVFAGESRNPKKVKEEILKEIERVRVEGLDENAFDHCVKAAWGSVIRLYSNASNVATMLTSTYLSGLEGFDYLEVIRSVTKDELEQLIPTSLNPERCILSVVNPS